MGFAIAAAAIGVGASIGADEIKKSGIAKSTQEILDAIHAQKDLDIPALKDLASSTDKEKYAAGLSAEDQLNPDLAALRTTGEKNLLAGLTSSSQENSLLSSLQNEGLSDSPKRAAIINTLFDNAQKELARGSTLDPAFQAEVVRSGLEQSGQAGIGADYRGAAGVQQRTLLGSAGLALQQQRQNNASQLLSLADQLKSDRASILSGVLASTQNTRAAQQNMNAQAFAFGQAGVPSIGLSGADASNLSISNTNADNQRLLQAANVTAQGVMARSSLTADEVKQGGQFLSSLVGGAGGMAGGGGGAGGMGSIMGMFGGGGGGGGSISGPSTGYQTGFAYLPYQSAPQYSYINPKGSNVGYLSAVGGLY